MPDLTSNGFEALRSDEDFVLCRGRNIDGSSQILLLSPATVNPSPIILRRLDNEYSLREELDPGWSARPIAVTRHMDRTVAERSNIAGRLRCTFRSNLQDDESLPIELRQDVLRIAQEAISNALRQAKSTAISVTLRFAPPNLILKVKDDGVGMTSKAETKEGFGFVNMRARVKKLNGTLEIRTAPGSGTSIIVRVPVKG